MKLVESYRNTEGQPPQRVVVSLGDYVLKTERALDAAQTWSLYMILLQAEEGFACLKGTLGLRPNFHQLEHRVEAHMFMSVLAYHLLTWVRETLRHSGDPPGFMHLHSPP